MKRIVFVAKLAIVFYGIVFYGCGGDDDVSDPSRDLTGLQADIDEKFEALQEEINTLRGEIAKGQGAVTEGAVEVDLREPAEVIQDQTGGLPPSGEPTGEPVDDPAGGVAVFGGGRIVFSSAGRIYVMDANGGNRRLVVAKDGVAVESPSLSPNGQTIAYRNGTAVGNMHIHIHQIESGRDFRLTDGAFDRAADPAWSPDADKIVFVDGGSIMISTVDPFHPQVFQITHDDLHTSPTWSPDGKQIAFSSVLDGKSNIFAIDVNGRNRIRLTNHPAEDEHPDWSPDGRHIAFMTHRHGTWDIYLVNTRTFVETHLTEGMNPSWSPDGTKIAFGEGEIFVMNADGTGMINITNSPGYEGSPNW